MKRNVGSFDKVIRLVIATVLIILTIAGNIKGTMAVVAMILSAILVITSLVSFCPVWALFGLSSKKSSKPIIPTPERPITRNPETKASRTS